MPKLKFKKLVIGVTGSLGSGKTTVSGMLGCLGGKIVDADKIAHEIIKPYKKIYKKIVRVFGREVLKKDGSVDRRKLGQIVFKSSSALGTLNKIMHPEIIRLIKEDIQLTKKKIIVLDAPLLVEAGLLNFVDYLIVVRAKKDAQLERVSKKSGIKKSEIIRRMKAQYPISAKVRLADFIIDNSRTLENTKKQVKEIWRKIKWKN